MDWTFIEEEREFEIISDFRTQKFKNKITHIIETRGHANKCGRIRNNLRFDGRIKEIFVNRKRTTDLVSYYYVERKLHTITYNDIVKIDDITIKSEKKIKVEPKVDLVVGRYYGLGERLIKIVSKTPRQYKYSLVYYRLPDDISEKRREYFNLQYSFYECVKIEDLTVITESESVDGVLKLNKYGDWFEGGRYTYKSISYDEIICSDSVL